MKACWPWRSGPELRPASSGATAGPAAELAAELDGSGASQPVPFSVDGTVVLTAVQHQGRQAVEEAGRPSLDLFDDTPGAAAEPAAALVPPGASQPELVPADGTVAPIASFPVDDTNLNLSVPEDCCLIEKLLTGVKKNVFGDVK